MSFDHDEQKRFQDKVDVKISKYFLMRLMHLWIYHQLIDVLQKKILFVKILYFVCALILIDQIEVSSLE